MKASAAALLLALAACSTTAPGADTTQASPTPAPPPMAAAAAALDPVGHYEYATVVDGSPMSGTIHIEGQPGSYAGRLESNLFPSMTVSNVAVAGQQMTMVVTTPDGAAVTLTFNFTGSNFSGNWSMGGGGQSGTITGRKVM